MLHKSALFPFSSVVCGWVHWTNKTTKGKVHMYQWERNSSWGVTCSFPSFFSPLPPPSPPPQCALSPLSPTAPQRYVMRERFERQAEMKGSVDVTEVCTSRSRASRWNNTKNTLSSYIKKSKYLSPLLFVSCISQHREACAWNAFPLCLCWSNRHREWAMRE